jgi:lysozyme
MNILLRLIRRFEGCKLKAYLCPAGVWTIGWGATGPGISPGVTWTQEEADQRLDVDAFKYWMIALKASPTLALYPEVHEAIADFCYNLGGTKYRSSTLKRKIDAGEWDEACEQIERWVFGGGRKLNGLVARRLAERQVIEEYMP